MIVTFDRFIELKFFIAIFAIMVGSKSRLALRSMSAPTTCVVPTDWIAPPSEPLHRKYDYGANVKLQKRR